MSRLSDLVRDSKLEVELRDECIVHISFEHSHASGRRGVPREEIWKDERKIGGGGFGSVWLQKCTSGRHRDEVRAVKKINLGGRNFSSHAAYIRELEAIAKFSHPKYVHCFVQSSGWYECLGCLCIAMEYCELGDLQAYLSSEPPLPEIQAQEITFQTLEGVRYMHENEFAHRDLKPSNILIKSRPPKPWWIKIADFGISKRIEETMRTSTAVIGTPLFMAPELRMGIAAHFIIHGSAFPNLYAADMWSLGEIAFQMLTKQASLYVNKLQPFPNAVLARYGVSSCGQDFVSSIMRDLPDSRLKAVEAWDHQWMKEFKSSQTPARIGGEEQGFATWRSGPVSSRPRSRSEIASDAETPTPSPQHAQPHTLILRPQPERQIAYSLEAGGLLKTLKGHISSVLAVVFSPNGKLLASASDYYDRTVRLWDADSGQLLQSLRGHTDAVLTVVFSTDSMLLASGSIDKTVRLWDAGSGQLLKILKGHSGPVLTVAFFPDGKRLASGSSDRTVGLWNADSGCPMQTLKRYSSATVLAVAFSPDGERLAFGSDDCTVRLWDAGSGELLQTLKEHAGAVWAVAFSPDGKRLASGSVDMTVRLWNADSGHLLQTLNRYLGGTVLALAFSSDGKRLASGSEDKTVSLWDPGSGRLLQTLRGSGRVFSMAFSPDSKQLVSASDDWTVKLWRVGSGGT